MKTPLVFFSNYGFACLMLISLSTVVNAGDQKFEEVAKDINKHLKEIQKNTNTINEQAPVINNQIKTIKENTPDITNNIKEINKEMPVINDQIKTIKENTPDITNNIKEINKQTPVINDQVKTIKESTPEIKNNIKEIKKQTPQIKEQLKFIKEHAPKIQKQLQVIKKNTPDKKQELMNRLLKANDQGLSSLLKKLSAGGGKFELIEKGGIRIIPNNADKAKQLSKLNSAVKGSKSRINSWLKAKKVAKGWLKQKNKKALYLGKIRQVKRLYIVSIVTKKGRLDTQLVIRVTDGKTVAFGRKEFEIFD